MTLPHAGTATLEADPDFDAEVAEFDRDRPSLHDEVAVRERYGDPDRVDDEAPTRSHSGEIVCGYRDLRYTRLLPHGIVLFRFTDAGMTNVIYVPRVVRQALRARLAPDFPPMLGLTALAGLILGLLLMLGQGSSGFALVGMVLAIFGGPTISTLLAWQVGRALGLPIPICQLLGAMGYMAGAFAMGFCLMTMS